MFRILKKDSLSRARLGILETPHGVVQTPAYAIVATHGKVRTLEPCDIPKTKTQIIIANTYHLWRSLGEEKLKTFEGLHKMMGWGGPLMTDSGGFQVFSLGISREQGIGKVMRKSPAKPRPERNLVTITDDGVFFSEGEENLFLNAELSIKIQEQLGADIIVAFDEPTSPASDYSYTKEAMMRTHIWAFRSLRARRSSQLMYGVIQGGSFEGLRKESASVLARMPFDGFAIGGAFGNSFGDLKKNTFKEISWSLPLLPEDKPHHLLGIGQPDDLFEGVLRGVDTFDCVIPTREARHGSLWTRQGRIDITRPQFAADMGVLDPQCNCPVCTERQINRKTLRDLFKSKDSEAGYLATLHNVYFFNNLMSQMRESIALGKFLEFRKSWADDCWGA